MSETAIVALITGPAALFLDRLITWLRNRKKDDAEAGLTIDQRWEKYTDALEGRVDALETRVSDLEKELTAEQKRRKDLEAEVARYKRIARSLARHVLRLRELLANTNVPTPTLPMDVEEAMTIIELP